MNKLFQLILVVFFSVFWSFASNAQTETYRQIEPLAGSWIVTQVNSEGIVGTAIVGIRPHLSIECVPDENNGCRFEQVWRQSQTLDVSHYKTISGRIHKYDFNNFEVLNRSAGKISLKRGTLPTRNVELTIVSPDLMQGEWAALNISGTVKWERLQSRINTVFTSEFSRSFKYSEPINQFRPDEIITLNYVEKYNEAHWGTTNNMRGNRMGFNLLFYGENLFSPLDIQFPNSPGFEPSTDRAIINRQANNAFGNIAGRIVEIRLWHNAKPGRHKMIVNGREFLLNLQVDGFPCQGSPVFSVEQNGFGVVEAVKYFRPVRINAQFTNNPGCEELPIEVFPEQAASITTSLEPDVSGLRFQSDWYVPLPNSNNNIRDYDDLSVNQDSTRQANLVLNDFRTRFAGNWQIVSTDQRYSGGIITLGRDKSAAIATPTADASDLEISVSSKIVSSEQDVSKVSEFIARFQPAEANQANLALSGREIKIDTLLQFKSSFGWSRFDVDEETRPDSRMLHLSMPTEFMETDGPPPFINGTLRFGNEEPTSGRIKLVKDAEYLSAIVLEDQNPANSPDAMRRMLFEPVSENGVPISVKRKMAILGRNLPDELTVTFEQDDSFAHNIRSLSQEDRATIAERFELTDNQRTALEGWTFDAIIERGTRPGLQTVLANGSRLRWELDYANALGVLQLYRKVGGEQSTDDGEEDTREFDVIETLSPYEEFHIAVKALTGMATPESGSVKVVRSITNSGTGELTRTSPREINLNSVTINNQNFLLSDAITLSTAERGDQATFTNVRAGYEDFIFELNPTDIRVTGTPLVASVQNLAPSPWDLAIRLANACSESSRTISRTVLTNLFSFRHSINQQIKLSVEDHAAVIVLRDAVVAEMNDLSRRLNRIDLVKARELRKQQAQTSWFNAPGNVPNWGRVRLGELAKPNADLRTRWIGRITDLTEQRAGELANTALMNGINNLVEKLPQSSRDLAALNHCSKLKEIIEQIAYPHSGAMSRALRSLVVETSPEESSGSAEPRRNIVRSQSDARRHVKSIWVVGNHLRAINDLSDADTAVVTTTASGLLVLAGGLLAEIPTVWAAQANVAVASSDVLFNAIQSANSIPGLVTTPREIDNAGARAPIIGPEAFERALRKKPSVPGTLFSAFMSGMSVNSAKEAWKNLNIARGRKLAAELDDFSEATLNGLSPQQRADIAAYSEYVRQTGRAARSKGNGFHWDRFRNNNPDAEKTGQLYRSRVNEVASASHRELDEINEMIITSDTGDGQIAVWERRVADGGAVTPRDRLLWMGARESGLVEPAPNSIPPARLETSSNDVTQLEIPSLSGFRRNLDVDLPSGPLPLAEDLVRKPSNKLSTLQGETPGYGHRMMTEEQLTDFATNPRIKLTEDATRLRPRPDVYAPWKELEDVDMVNALQRQTRYGNMDLSKRLEHDNAVRSAIDEAAAVGNPWARRLQEDIARNRFEYGYDAGLPDEIYGVGVRADDGLGAANVKRNGPVALLNPTRFDLDGNLEFRTPEELATTLIHEYAHTWRGGQPYHDALSPDPQFVLRGEYNETRAFLAEGRFVRDLEFARSLNNRAFARPTDIPIYNAAGRLAFDETAGLKNGVRLKNLLARNLADGQEYANIYRDTVSRVIGMSGRSGGSEIALKRQVDKINAKFESPEYARLAPATKELMRNAALEELIAGFTP